MLPEFERVLCLDLWNVMADGNISTISQRWYDNSRLQKLSVLAVTMSKGETLLQLYLIAFPHKIIRDCHSYYKREPCHRGVTLKRYLVSR